MPDAPIVVDAGPVGAKVGTALADAFLAAQAWDRAALTEATEFVLDSTVDRIAGRLRARRLSARSP